MSHQIKRRRFVLPAAVATVSLALVVGCDSSPEPVESTPAQPVASTERHIALDGQPNFRDVGGYETADGRTVK